MDTSFERGEYADRAQAAAFVVNGPFRFDRMEIGFPLNLAD